MLTLRKRGTIWHVRGTIGDRRVETSTKCTDRRAAQEFLRAMERDLADPVATAKRAADATTLATVIDLARARYASAATAGRCSAATSQFYEAKWLRLLEVLGGDLRINSITVATLRRYVDARRATGIADHTIVKEVTALRVALRVARDAGLWAGVFEALVPSDLRAQYVPETRALSVSEVQRLVRELPPDRAAWVALMAGAGAEISAAARALRSDYDPTTRLVRVRGQKRETRDRWVPVVLPVCRALLEFAWRVAEGDAPKLLRPWNTPWRDIQAACRRAGIEPCSAHDLRRTFAHWHLEAGHSYDDVARALGHANTVMLHRVYGKLPPTALRDRMELGRSAAHVVPSKERATLRTLKTQQDPHPFGSAVNQGLSGCRRSELNQRPWDYDAPRLAYPPPRNRKTNPRNGTGRVPPVRQKLMGKDDLKLTFPRTKRRWAPEDAVKEPLGPAMHLWKGR